MRARVAAHDPVQRLGHRLEEHRRQSRLGQRADAIAVAPRVFGCDHAFLASDADDRRATIAHELSDGLGIINLGRRQVAEAAQQVVQRIGRVGIATTQVALDLCDRIGIEQVA